MRALSFSLFLLGSKKTRSYHANIKRTSIKNFKKSNIFRQNTEYKSNISNYIGKTCTIEDVLPNNTYRIKVFSEIWTATSDEILVKGDICKIIDRKDNTFIIEKQ